MKAYITKYALTEGIVEVDDAEVYNEHPSMITVKSLGPFATFHGEGREWHKTRESAVARAEEMQKKKIVSLRKALKKMEAMKFE